MLQDEVEHIPKLMQLEIIPSNSVISTWQADAHLKKGQELVLLHCFCNLAGVLFLQLPVNFINISSTHKYYVQLIFPHWSPSCHTSVIACHVQIITLSYWTMMLWISTVCVWAWIVKKMLCQSPCLLKKILFIWPNQKSSCQFLITNKDFFFKKHICWMNKLETYFWIHMYMIATIMVDFIRCGLA